MKTGDATPFCQLKAPHQTVIVKRDTQNLSTAGPFVFIRVHSWFPTAWIRLSHAPTRKKWSVSRTSNFFVVGLLLPILATKPNGLFEVWIVLEDANGPAPSPLAASVIRLALAFN